MWASRCHAERDDERRQEHLLRSQTSWQCTWHTCCCWTAPIPPHIPSLFCTIPMHLGLAMKLPFFMHYFMLFSLSESALTEGESTLHNNHFFCIIWTHGGNAVYGLHRLEFQPSKFHILFTRVLCIFSSL